MYSDSRKAQRNSFAHHRAQLLFSRRRSHAGDVREWAATVLEGTEPPSTSRKQQVMAGLLGLIPASMVAAHT